VEEKLFLRRRRIAKGSHQDQRKVKKGAWGEGFANRLLA
jgi:hypothetical protein